MRSRCNTTTINSTEERESGQVSPWINIQWATHPYVQVCRCATSVARGGAQSSSASSSSSVWLLLVVAEQVGRHLARQVVIVVFITSKIIWRVPPVFVLSAGISGHIGNTQLEQREPHCHQTTTNQTIRYARTRQCPLRIEPLYSPSCLLPLLTISC